MNNNIHLNEEKMNSFASAAVQYNVEKQLREKYAKLLASPQKENQKRKSLFHLSTLLKIAATAIIIFGGIFLMQNSLSSPTANSLAQKLLDQTNIPGNPDITRKGSNPASALRREANDAFTLKNYPLSISKYNLLKSTEELTPLDRFYLGISHLKSNNPSEAIDIFIEIRDGQNFGTEEIDWFLSLAYALSNQEQNAIPLLQKIISENRYKASEAEKLMGKLK